MGFTAKNVAELRAKTGAGMMDCKKALTETDGDMEKASEYLRKKGIASAEKKSGKIAAEGVVACKVTADNKTAVIVEVNTQTDFVAKNDKFLEFVSKVADVALNNKTKTIDELLAADLGGKSVKDAAVEQTATTGEKVDVRRVEFVEADVVGAYVHPVGSKVGSLVAITGEADATKANDIAMHVAAAAPEPEFTTRDEISADEIAKEKEIEMGKDDIKGKPPEIAEKIVEGRVNKLLAAKVLVEQPYIKDPNQKVSEYLGSAKVAKFVRVNLGEGIEKKEDDFAAEVASMTGAA